MNRKIAVFAMFLSMVPLFGAETSVWSHPLNTKPEGTSYKYRFSRPGFDSFTAEGLVFRDDGKGKVDYGANLEFPEAVARAMREGQVMVSMEVKVENVKTDRRFGWILREKTDYWRGNCDIPKNASGWNSYSFVPHNAAMPGIKALILRIPVPKEGNIAVRNITVRAMTENLDLKPFYNTGYRVDNTPEGRKNFTGNASSDFRKFRFPGFERFANVPLKPQSASGKVNAKEVIRFSNNPKLPGIREITVPVKKENFSARKLYLLHGLHAGGSDFKGNITVKGADGEQTFDVKFGRDIRNSSDPENKRNAVNGHIMTANWGRAVQCTIVSEFNVRPEVGAVKSVTFNIDPGKGIYLLFAAQLSNYAYTLDRRPLKVFRQDAEWVPFPFPKKSGVYPGSILDTGVKKPVPAGKYGRLVSGPNGELVAERQKNKPLRFRMQGTGGSGYFANLTDPDVVKWWAEHLKRTGGKIMTDYVFTPYSEDLKKNIESFSRALAMQNYTMFRVCGFYEFTRLLGADFTEKEMDNFFYTVKCFKDNGIYIHLDIGHAFCKGRAWTNDNAKQRSDARFGLFFNPQERARLKAGMQKILLTVNPYTGLALKDDPVIAFINGWNENPLQFRIYTEPEAHERFSQFLGKRYPDFNALKKAWGKFADPGWRSFSDIPVNFAWAGYHVKANPRKADMMDFYIQCQIERLDWYRKTLREIGYKGMISDYNFGQGLEGMRSRKNGDYVVMNNYHEHPFGRWIGNKSPIETENNLIRSLTSVQFLNRPYVATETGVCFWNQYRYEQPFILDAYAALNGFDVLTNFAGILPNRGGGFQNDDTVIRTFFGIFDPIMHASEFLGAHFFNLGKIKTADSQVRIELDAEEIAKAQEFNYALGSNQLMLALVCRFGVEWKDEHRPVGSNEMLLPRVSRSGVVKEKFFANLVDIKDNRFNADACIREMKKKGLIPENNRTNVENGIFESVTGELFMDSKKKFGSVNTPTAQGIFALAGTKHKLPNFDVREMTKNGMLNIVSADGRNLGESRRMAVVYATNALNLGMVFKDDTMRILVLNGTGPILYQTGKFTVVVRNKNASKLKAWVVRLDGSRDGELPVTANGDELTFSVDTAKIKGGPAVFFELAEK